jgi:chaperonin GroEL
MHNNKPTTTILNDNLQYIIDGIKLASDVVISTMGGSGKNVILNTDNELKFTKDGVSVAKAINLPDPQNNIGAKLLINAANKTVEQCGDGTTSTILFVRSLVDSPYIQDITDKNQFIEDLDDFVNKFEEIIMAQSKQIDNIDDIYKIAITSCKSNKVAGLIKDIYSKTGFQAHISLEESRVSDKTYFDLVEGLNFESGMVNSRFANQDNGNCVYENVLLLLEEDLVSSPQSYEKILSYCLDNDQALVIMAPMFSDAFIRFALTNKNQNGLKICLIKTPGYGNYSKENYKDILAFSNDNSTVNKIVVSQHDFTIYNHPETTKLKKRLAQLEKLAENCIEDYDETDYRNRIHRLNQTSAIIYVGGVTEKNIKEEYDRIEDALGAVTSALKSGYVRGAGVELVQIIPLFKDHPLFKLIKDILYKPYTQILKNANITRTLKTDVPYNVRSKSYDENIIDASSIVINSLKNATSLFKLLINTSYVVHNE